MQKQFEVKIHCPTGFAVSFADSRDGGRYKNRLKLPTLSGEPFIPASSIRGKLRHNATGMVVDALAERGKKLRLDDLYLLAIGGVRQGKDDSKKEHQSADMMKYLPLLLDNMWLSFWGCSVPMFVSSKVQIENARPDGDRPIKIDEIPGQRSDPMQRREFLPDQVSDPEAFDDMVESLTQAKTQATARKSRRGKPAETENGETEPNGEPSPNDPKIVTGNMPFGREIVPPGSRFKTYIDIRRVSELQIGMFVATLRRFAQQPVFGAQAGMNLGLVDLTMTTPENDEITIIGRSRQFEASSGLVECEKQFWDAFPSIDFSMPRLDK